MRLTVIIKFKLVLSFDLSYSGPLAAAVGAIGAEVDIDVGLALLRLLAIAMQRWRQARSLRAY